VATAQVGITLASIGLGFAGEPAIADLIEPLIGDLIGGTATHVVAFVIAYAAAVPFMNTSLFTGPVADAWHGADVAYFVNFLVAAVLYGGYRLLGSRPANLDK